MAAKWALYGTEEESSTGVPSSSRAVRLVACTAKGIQPTWASRHVDIFAREAPEGRTDTAGLQRRERGVLACTGASHRCEPGPKQPTQLYAPRSFHSHFGTRGFSPVEMPITGSHDDRSPTEHFQVAREGSAAFGGHTAQRRVVVRDQDD